jgi:hypothetical protein
VYVKYVSSSVRYPKTNDTTLHNNYTMTSPAPHSTPLIIPPQRRSDKRPRNSVALRFIFLSVRVTFVLLLCGSSYLAGSILGHDSFLLDSTSIRGSSAVIRSLSGKASDRTGRQSRNDVGCKMTKEELIDIHVRRGLEKQMMRRRFPSSSMGRSLNGVVRVTKDDINEYFDFGNPMERGQDTTVEDALLLYQKKEAFPTSNESLMHSVEYDDGNGIPHTDVTTAIENCDAINVIFTGNPGQTRQCTAIVPNFESYHVQRWMKVDTVRTTSILPELPLVPVSRGYGTGRGGTTGKGHFYSPPSPSDGKLSPVKLHWRRLLPFFQNVDAVLEDLGDILKRIARNNAVVVLTCNHGQSELLINFACSARRRGFDLGNILVFPSDVETKELAEGLGLTTYFDVKVC